MKKCSMTKYWSPNLSLLDFGKPQGFTANDAAYHKWANDRANTCIDIANALNTKLIVLWLAREGTYIRESKNGLESHKYLVKSLNSMLEYDPKIEIAIESKPNEPMDHTYIPTIGHTLAIAHQTVDPQRGVGLIETTHAMLAGLDPSDEMTFALVANKLWSVHLNDQNGFKFDQDKTFGAANLRGAYNQVRILELAGYAETERFIGLDIKAMRSQKPKVASQHLSNSRTIFLKLVEKVRSFPKEVQKQCIDQRDYEAIKLAIIEHLLGD